MCRCGPGYSGPLCELDDGSYGEELASLDDGFYTFSTGNLSQVWSVEFAYFGRNKSADGDFPGCYSPSALTLLRYKCDGRNTCQVSWEDLHNHLPSSCHPAISPRLSVRLAKSQVDDDWKCAGNGKFLASQRTCLQVLSTVWKSPHDAKLDCNLAGGDLAFYQHDLQLDFCPVNITSVWAALQHDGRSRASFDVAVKFPAVALCDGEISTDGARSAFCEFPMIREHRMTTVSLVKDTEEPSTGRVTQSLELDNTEIYTDKKVRSNLPYTTASAIDGESLIEVIKFSTTTSTIISATDGEPSTTTSTITSTTTGESSFATSATTSTTDSDSSTTTFTSANTTGSVSTTTTFAIIDTTDSEFSTATYTYTTITGSTDGEPATTTATQSNTSTTSTSTPSSTVTQSNTPTTSMSTPSSTVTQSNTSTTSTSTPNSTVTQSNTSTTSTSTPSSTMTQSNTPTTSTSTPNSTVTQSNTSTTSTSTPSSTATQSNTPTTSTSTPSSIVTQSNTSTTSTSTPSSTVTQSNTSTTSTSTPSSTVTQSNTSTTSTSTPTSSATITPIHTTPSTIPSTVPSNSSQCPETVPFPDVYPEYTWSAANPGKHNKSCPDNTGAQATWTCGHDGQWIDLPDLSECKSLDFNIWEDQFNDNTTNTTAGEMLGDFVTNITQVTLAPGDIVGTVGLLDVAHQRHLRDLQDLNDPQQVLNVTESYVFAVTQVSSKLMEKAQVRIT
ncbi:uncharacterized protein [Panulirus ornatus]|uniref:uncharacterized protein n=1 Tax=Panulirus ornatus TaxID=150431 RepID=UPI003A87804C